MRFDTSLAHSCSRSRCRRRTHNHGWGRRSQPVSLVGVSWSRSTARRLGAASMWRSPCRVPVEARSRSSGRHEGRFLGRLRRRLCDSASRLHVRTGAPVRYRDDRWVVAGSHPETLIVSGSWPNSRTRPDGCWRPDTPPVQPRWSRGNSGIRAVYAGTVVSYRHVSDGSGGL